MAVLASGCASSHGRDDLDGAGSREGGLFEVGVAEVGVADVGPVDVGSGEVGADVPDAPRCPPERCDGLDQDCDGVIDEAAECAVFGASAACIDGACRFVACDATHADCNADVADGCEADTASDRERCGGCGLRCGMTETCEESVCVRERIVDMAPGGFMSCVLLGSGRVLCWGTNEYGSLGPEYPREGSPVPVEIHGLPRNLVALSDTLYASGFALTDDGEVWAWGPNHKGFLGIGFLSREPQPPTRALVSGIRDVHVAAGEACAVDDERGLWCWGDHALIPADEGVATPRRQVLPGSALRITGSSTLSWFATTTVGPVTWGLDSYGVRGAAIPTGADAPVTAFDPPMSPRAVDCGSHCCAILEPGSVTCWGSDFSGALGDGPPDDARWIEPVGVAFHGPVEVTVPSNPVDVVVIGDVGFDIGACVRYADGAVWCWGGEQASGLGHQASSPERLTLPAAATRLFGGRSGCVTLEGDTRLYCWGRNVWGDLGDGSVGRPSAVPVPVVGFE